MEYNLLCLFLGDFEFKYVCFVQTMIPWVLSEALILNESPFKTCILIAINVFWLVRPKAFIIGRHFSHLLGTNSQLIIKLSSQGLLRVNKLTLGLFAKSHGHLLLTSKTNLLWLYFHLHSLFWRAFLLCILRLDGDKFFWHWVSLEQIFIQIGGHFT